MLFPKLFPRVCTVATAVSLILALQVRAGETEARAFGPPPRDLFEVSLGFDYIRAPDQITRNFAGFDASGFVNLNSWLGLGADFIAGYGKATVHRYPYYRPAYDVDEDRYIYLFGPRVTVWQNPQFRTFIEGLVGGAHADGTVTLGNLSHSSSAEAFAAMLGAGADWRFTRHWAWRVLEGGYLPTHFQNTWQDKWSVSSAIVYSFGGH